jgi:hypothetical protein
MKNIPPIFDELLKGFEWVIFDNGDKNSTLCYVNRLGECYLRLTPSGKLLWHPDMYDKHYSRYGLNLMDFRIYIRNMVTSRFARYVFECKKQKNKSIKLL